MTENLHTKIQEQNSSFSCPFVLLFNHSVFYFFCRRLFDICLIICHIQFLLQKSYIFIVICFITLKVEI
jgi:hypothetical protein